MLCQAAGFQDLDLCENCLVELTCHTEKRCYRCANVLEADDDFYCKSCVSCPPSFDRTLAPFIHQSAVRYLVINLKFHAHQHNAKLFGTLMANFIKHQIDKNDLPECLIPIPLHPKRYRERGFNQSLEIAKTLSKQLHIPYDANSCVRFRYTQQQAKLNAHQRHDNMKNAFKIIKPLKFKHIAIIDDVMTTGLTVQELAKELKAAGAHRVQVWVCSKAR